MARTQRRLMTADDLWRLPDDNLRHELVRGELRTMSPGGRRHGRVTMNVSTPLDQHVRTHGLGEVYTAETGYVLAQNPDTVRAPDVSFVSRDRLAALGDPERYGLGAPDLAVEVLSPNDRPGEVAKKVADWLASGTRLLWVADPRRRSVTEHRPGVPLRVLGQDDWLDGQDVVPGWRLSVRALFAGLAAD
jgi:Uma2 family endonuclease